MNKKYKRGDERNGKIFWSYEKECLNGERWITKEKFDSMVLENKRFARERYLKNKLKSKTIDKKYTRGDIKEDLVFWGYNYSYNNLEKWVSIEEFNRLKEKERIRYSERYNKNKENDIFRLVKNFRKSIGKALREQSTNKNIKSHELLGITGEEFMNFLLDSSPSEFTKENYGILWELDHIRPIASFNLENKDELLECFSYKNHQALSIKENRSKGSLYNNKRHYYNK